MWGCATVVVVVVVVKHAHNTITDSFSKIADVASSPSEDFNGSSTIEVDQSKSTVDETQCSAQQTQDEVRSNAAEDRNNKAAVPSSAAAVVKSEDYTSIKRFAEVESDARVIID